MASGFFHLAGCFQGASIHVLARVSAAFVFMAGSCSAGDRPYSWWLICQWTLGLFPPLAIVNRSVLGTRGPERCEHTCFELFPLSKVLPSLSTVLEGSGHLAVWALPPVCSCAYSLVVWGPFWLMVLSGG